jgi:hypothetical protein
MHLLAVQGVVPVKLDTGAGADIMNEDYYALQERTDLCATSVWLTDHNDKSIAVKGECICTVHIKG